MSKPNWSAHPSVVLAVILLVSIIGWSEALPFRRTLGSARIVGGTPASYGEFPYQISLRINGGHACGGSIVGKKWVITAAHCCDPKSAYRYTVRAGCTDFNDPDDKVYSVSNLIVHPDYKESEIDCDYCMVELAENITMVENKTAIIKMHGNANPEYEDTMSVVSGWGTLTEGGGSSSRLQCVYVPVISNEDCSAAYDPMWPDSITDNMLCAGYPEGGKDACQGDSGGPLVVDDELLAVVSWGYGCGRANYPGVYARLTNAAVSWANLCMGDEAQGS